MSIIPKKRWYDVIGRPFRLTAPVVPENDLHEAVANAMRLLVMPPAEWTTFPAGSVPLPPEYAAKLYRMGLRRNWPDIQIVHDGIFHGVELKRVGGKLSKTHLVRSKRGRLRLVEGQADLHPRLEAAGARLAVCSSVDAVLDQLRAWNIPMRRVT
jgi:hypothetical protein